MQSSFLAKQPKHPPSASSSWHSRATGWLQTQFRATSKWRLEKAQMVNCSRIPINYKETDIIQDCLGKTRPLAEIEMLQTNNTLFVCLFKVWLEFSEIQSCYKWFFEHKLKKKAWSHLCFTSLKGVHNAQQNPTPIRVGLQPVRNNSQIQWSQPLCMMDEANALPQTVPPKLLQ